VKDGFPAASALQFRNSRKAELSFGGGQRMSQTVIGYCADLFFHPFLVGVLLLYEFNGKGFALHSCWCFAFCWLTQA
jgi:hypothetical protein